MSDGTDNGFDASGELPADVADLAALLPDDDGAGGGDGADAGADPTTAVLKQFDDDPAKLASSYAHAQRKISEQGAELGEARKLVAALTGQVSQLVGKAAGGAGGGASGDGGIDEFLEELQKAQDDGGQLDLTKVVGELYSRLRGEFQQQMEPMQQGMLGMNQAIGFAQFLENNPSAKRYSRLMQGLIKRDPDLLPPHLTGQAFNRKLSTLHDLARGVEQKLRGSTGALDRGSPDAGTTRRVSRRTSEADREQIRLRQQFMETGRDQEMAKLVERALSR